MYTVTMETAIQKMQNFTHSISHLKLLYDTLVVSLTEEPAVIQVLTDQLLFGP